LRRELLRLHRELDLTIILVTHDQAEALSLSDRIMVLDHGRTQQVAAPTEAYLRPANRFVADFLGTANRFEGVLQDDAGISCLRLDDGAVMPCAAPRLTRGQKVAAIVRPERVRIEPASPPGADGAGLPATVADVIYLGQSLRYHLELRPDKSVIATAADRGVRFAPGTAVRLTWRPDDIWLIPD